MSISRLKKNQLALENALQRVELLNEKKSQAIGERLRTERMKFEKKAQKLRALEEARKREMNVIFSVKFELADLEKKLRYMRASNERKKKVSVQQLNLHFHI